MAKRKILLLEPNYKNKYPPIGLMKLATYHRLLEDDVTFFKGDLRSFIVHDIASDLLSKLNSIDNSVSWAGYFSDLVLFIKTGKNSIFNKLLENTQFVALVKKSLHYFRDYFIKKEYEKKPKWDRVCITTLFTFHWKMTVDTIVFAKILVKDPKELWVGGVLATLLHDELKKETGIETFRGLLDQPGILDKNDLVIENLPLDYSILDEIDYSYPEKNAFYGYATRGCVNKCSFCAVPKLEPKFENYIPLLKSIDETRSKFGDHQNLLLLDNNILASKELKKIVKEIKKAGFKKGEKFIEPNQYEIAINNLRLDYNAKAQLRRIYNLIQSVLPKIRKGEYSHFQKRFQENGLLNPHTITKEKVLEVYPDFAPVFEKYRNKTSKGRSVDFNQGLDARLLNEDKMAILSELPIRPLRIAFDKFQQKEIYEKAVRLAAKYGFKHLSNYLLYNHDDLPEELYRRLEINVLLCEELDVNIHSFPMKYHPIGMVDGIEYYKNRDYLGGNWNRKFIRSIQIILNATKGKIGRSKSFFYEAFGANLDEFNSLLYMPEDYILYRFFFKEVGLTKSWKDEFMALSSDDQKAAKEVIETNNFIEFNGLKLSKTVEAFLRFHYIESKKALKNASSSLAQKKAKFDKTNIKSKYGKSKN